MSIYTKHYNARRTPQTQQIPGRADQVENSAGGYVFQVDEWVRLERFLILGSEKGTYYATEKKLTLENARHVEALIRKDGGRVVQTVVEIAEKRRAPKADPSIFVLAMASVFGDEATRKAAYDAMPKVLGTFTMLAQFLNARKALGANPVGGKGIRRGIKNWYKNLGNPDLHRVGLQMVKYRNREGWSHRDVLRLAHITPDTSSESNLYAWAVGKDFEWNKLPKIVRGFELARTAETPRDTIRLIEKYNLPHEAVRKEHLSDPQVWEALIPGMPINALVRNLAHLTEKGVIAPGREMTHVVVDKLTDPEAVRKSRIHPFSVLLALMQYQSGYQNIRDSRGWIVKTSWWRPVTAVVDALDELYYLAAGNVTPTNKRIMLTLDLSNSMNQTIIGTDITARQGSAAMAMITANTEPRALITGFTAGGDNPTRFHRKSREGLSLAISELRISKRQRLDDIVNYIESVRVTGGFGGTDCSLPMQYALQREIPVDAFVVYTDSETWAGRIHPVQALREYRQKMGLDAKLIVVGMVSNGFTIADPSDRGMLDVVGFDSAAPNIISDFIMQD